MTPPGPGHGPHHMPCCIREGKQGVHSIQQSFGLPAHHSIKYDRQTRVGKLPSKCPHLLKTDPAPMVFNFLFKYVALPWEPAEPRLTHSSQHLLAHKTNKHSSPPLPQASLGSKDVFPLTQGPPHLSLLMCARHEACPDFVW